jgi:hydrogenase large subunit
VDVVSALKADPKATSTLAQSISSWPLSSPGYFRDIQNRPQENSSIPASLAPS